MTQQQIAYIAAKAALETAKEAARKEAGPTPWGGTDTEIEAHCALEIAAEKKYSVWALEDALRTAEAELFTWARTQLATLPQYAARKDDIEKVFTTKNLAFRKKAVDLCLKMAAA